MPATAARWHCAITHSTTCAAVQVGSDMYFINSGECDVIGPDGSMVLATLGPQEFFGELALLTRMRRTATIQAKTYCDLSVLSRYQLDRLLDKNPGTWPIAALHSECERRWTCAAPSEPQHDHWVGAEVEANMREVARERVEVRGRWCCRRRAQASQCLCDGSRGCSILCSRRNS